MPLQFQETSMASSIVKLPLIVFLAVLVFFNIPVDSREDGHVAARISDKGLDFVKDLLIRKAESSLFPLELADIEKSVKIPLIGRVTIGLSDITIEAVHVASSGVRAVDDGDAIVMEISGSTADLSTDWKYSYKNLIFVVSDKGTASIEVEGLEIDLMFRLRTVEGSLTLSLIDCQCNVTDLSIDVNGGASWLYQGLVDAFDGKIASAVENAICKKIDDSIVNLDSFLRSIPKEVPITKIASLNATFVGEPRLKDSRLSVQIDGLFSAKEQLEFPEKSFKSLPASPSSCENYEPMVELFLHEDVLGSLSSVYFEAKKMNWTVTKLSNETLLNTTEWKSIVPQLYDLYPDEDMSLNIVVTSPPTIRVEHQRIEVNVPLDATVEVLSGGGRAIQVACFSTVIGVSLSTEVSENAALAGNLGLTEFDLSLRWSKVGDLPTDSIQNVISKALKTVVVPYANAILSKGFKLPGFHGYELQDAHMHYVDSWIVLCGDVGRRPSLQQQQFLAI